MLALNHRPTQAAARGRRIEGIILRPDLSFFKAFCISCVKFNIVIPKVQVKLQRSITASKTVRTKISNILSYLAIFKLSTSEIKMTSNAMLASVCLFQKEKDMFSKTNQYLFSKLSNPRSTFMVVISQTLKKKTLTQIQSCKTKGSY